MASEKRGKEVNLNFLRLCPFPDTKKEQFLPSFPFLPNSLCCKIFYWESCIGFGLNDLDVPSKLWLLGCIWSPGKIPQVPGNSTLSYPRILLEALPGLSWGHVIIIIIIFIIVSLLLHYHFIILSLSLFIITYYFLILVLSLLFYRHYYYFIIVLLLFIILSLFYHYYFIILLIIILLFIIIFSPPVWRTHGLFQSNPILDKFGICTDPIAFSTQLQWKCSFWEGGNLCRHQDKCKEIIQASNLPAWPWIFKYLNVWNGKIS